MLTFSQPENTNQNKDCLQVTAGQTESSSDPLHADDQETRASLTVISVSLHDKYKRV